MRELRAQQQRNLLATLVLSQGVPMLLAGDEFGRTQGGNNNAYCQDNEISWVDWTLLQRHSSRVAFVRRLIDLRKSRLWLRRDTFLKGTRRGTHAKDVTWLHPTGREMTHADWNDSNLRSVAVHMQGATSRQSNAGDLLVVFNADEAPVTMALPAPPEGSLWVVVFDTAAADGDDATAGRLLQRNEMLTIDHRSTVLLESRPA